MSVEDVLAKVEVLPPMPAVAVKLINAAGDPDVDLGLVASLIERDPAMTANLLRLCNSPFYGLRAEVASVRQATSLLGLRKLVQIALTLLSSRYLSPPQKGYQLASGELWRSSVTSALGAELLAQEVKYPNPSKAYTAGLLQDVGKIVLADFVDDALPRIRILVEEEELSWEEAEERAIGMPHPEVGGILLERWGFPSSLIEAVRTHHNPSAATEDPALARISHVADALTMTLGMGLGADGMAYALDETALAPLGLTDPGRVDALVERLAEHVGQAGDLLRPPKVDP
jgi:HD-like signal output (HDOD) protein